MNLLRLLNLLLLYSRVDWRHLGLTDQLLSDAVSGWAVLRHGYRTLPLQRSDSRILRHVIFKLLMFTTKLHHFKVLRDYVKVARQPLQCDKVGLMPEVCLLSHTLNTVRRSILHHLVLQHWELVRVEWDQTNLISVLLLVQNVVLGLLQVGVSTFQ